MRPAPAPRDPRSVRLLALDHQAGTVTGHPFPALPALLEPGDVLVVNDAATLPASLAGSWRGAPVEVRLAAARGVEPARLERIEWPVGLAIGVASFATPLYIAELSPTRRRGALV